MHWRLFGPKSNGFSGEIALLSDNLMGCTGLLLLLGGLMYCRRGYKVYRVLFLCFCWIVRECL